jgi:SAM-dependent methyltransferase
MPVELINPSNGKRLQRVGQALVDGDGGSFPVVNGIPRICEASNYADSFGKQWNAFRLTQIDSAEQELSRQRFFAETGWTSEQLDGVDLLEAGSGAGRFTRVVLEHSRAKLFSIDYSNAVEANLKTNADVAAGRLQVLQASITGMPFPDGSFDKIFCLGVLQHTPSVEDSVRALVQKAKHGGEIVVDFYAIRGWWTKLSAKYLLRPVTTRMAHDRLLRLIEGNIDWLLAAHRGLTRLRMAALTRFLPVVDLRTLPAGLTPGELRDWAVLDTFDMFSPAYDAPQRIEAVADMFQRSGADVTFAGFVDAGSAQAAVVRAVRR